MARTEKAIFTNLCMVYDDRGNILVQDRKNPDWKGVTFPGGHVEKDESFTDAVIREVFEETGLTITAKAGDYTYIYGQLANPKVSKGDTVKEGDPIATLA